MVRDCNQRHPHPYRPAPSFFTSRVLRELFYIMTLRYLTLRYAPIPSEEPDPDAPTHLSSEESAVLRRLARARTSILHFDDQALEPLEGTLSFYRLKNL